MMTFLRDAAETGLADILPETKVLRVLHEDDRAVGVEVLGADGKKAKIFSKVKEII